MRRTSLLVLCTLTLSLAWPVAAPADDTEVLGKKGSEWLKMLLATKSTPKQRRAALTALEIVGPKGDRVLQGLTVALLKDPDPEIRREVAQTLGRMGDDAKLTIPALATALADDKEALVREAAARSLGSMVPYSRSVVGELAKALKDKHGPTRTAAAATLKDLGAEAKSELPQVIALLKDAKDKVTEPAARVYAAQLVGRLAAEPETTVPVLAGIVAAKDDSPMVRVVAAEALGRFGAKAAAGAAALAAVAAEKKNDAALRRVAVASLGKVSDDVRVVWPVVKGALQDADSTLRSQAVRVAGPLGRAEKEVVAMLQTIARKDGNIEVRIAAIQELGQLGASAKSAEPTLADLAENDARPAVRQAAQAALKLIKGTTP